MPYGMWLDAGNRWFDDWLFSPHNKSETNALQILYGTKLGKLVLDYKMDKRETERYLNRWGLSYEDIYDFRRLPNTQSVANATRATLQYVSKTVNLLYK